MRTQFVVQHGEHRPYTSMISFVSSTVGQKGVAGLYAGLLPALLGVGPYMGLNFMFYESLRDRLHSHHEDNDDRHEKGKKEWTAMSLLFSGSAGAVAGGVSKFIIYPMVRPAAAPSSLQPPRCA